MRRILILAVLVLTGCTVPSHGTPTAAPPTVTAPQPGVPPCSSVHAEAAVAPGEGPSPDLWLTEIVLTNLGPGTCAVEGVSHLRLFSASRRLPVDQVVTPEGDVDLVILAEADQAAMSVNFPTAPEPAPACQVGAGRLEIILPGDTDATIAEARLPPICGPIAVTPWYFAGSANAS